MADWPTYQSHKIVQALPIVRKVDHGAHAVLFVDPIGDGTQQSFSPNMPDMALNARVGDYAMLYPDGYKSVCPKGEFEKGYTRV